MEREDHKNYPKCDQHGNQHVDPITMLEYNHVQKTMNAITDILSKWHEMKRNEKEQNP